MKCWRLFLSLFLVLVVSVTAFSLVAHADELPETDTATIIDEPETVQLTGQTEESPEIETEVAEPEETPEAATDGQSETPPDETLTGDTTSTDGEDTPSEYITSGDYELEALLTLKSIEYQLKIIAGGMVLALISLFIWFTILKPIKRFV